MSDNRGENEGFHMLDEWVGPAIPEPGVVPPGVTPGVGVNAGMDIPDEIVIDLRGSPGATADASVIDALTDRQRTALRLVVEGGSLAAVAQQLGLSAAQAWDTVMAAVESLRSRLRAS